MENELTNFKRDSRKAQKKWQQPRASQAKSNRKLKIPSRLTKLPRLHTQRVSVEDFRSFREKQKKLNNSMYWWHRKPVTEMKKMTMVDLKDNYYGVLPVDEDIPKMASDYAMMVLHGVRKNCRKRRKEERERALKRRRRNRKRRERRHRLAN